MTTFFETIGYSLENFLATANNGYLLLYYKQKDFSDSNQFITYLKECIPEFEKIVEDNNFYTNESGIWESLYFTSDIKSSDPEIYNAFLRKLFQNQFDKEIMIFSNQTQVMQFHLNLQPITRIHLILWSLCL